jgi:bacterioferritin-associated ferredoxin
MPEFQSKNGGCMACEKCLTVCPGLAITLVDYRYHSDEPIVAIPYEFEDERIKAAKQVTVLDTQGKVLGDLPVTRVERVASRDHTLIVKVKAPREIAARIAGIRAPGVEPMQPVDAFFQPLEDDAIVCRCERVTVGEIRQLIRQGFRDLNEIKAVTRAGMGACGSKTCHALLLRLFREEGIALNDVADATRRPIFVETPLNVLAGMTGETEESHV